MDITIKNECCKPCSKREPVPQTPIVPFNGFSNFTPTIPKLYWNVKSQEQRILNLFDLLDKLICYSQSIGEQVNINCEEIEELKKAFEELFNEESEFWKLFEKQLNNWIEENMTYLIKQSMRQVYFGLTDDGYFCGYVPSSWNEITFDTGAVYGRTDYGRLILRFDAEGRGVIDNTYSYSLNTSDTKVQQLIADVELNTRRTDSAFDTLFTNLDEVVEKTGDNI